MNDILRFLHIADVHLGLKSAYLEDEEARIREKDFTAAFEDAITFAAGPKNAIEFVIIAGDLFDDNKPSKTLIEFAKRQFAKLGEIGIHTFLIGGTHDNLSYPDCVLNKYFDNSEYFTIIKDSNIAAPIKKIIKGNPVYLYGFSHQLHKSTPPYDTFKKCDEDGIHIGIIHGSIEVGGSGKIDDIYVPLKLENLLKTGMDYIALGHYHSFRIVNEQSPMIVYPGTLESCKFEESESQHYIISVEIEPASHSVRLNKINYNQKHILIKETIDLTMLPDIKSEEELITYLKSRGSKNKIAQYTVEGNASFVFDSERVCEAVKDNYFYIKIDDITTIFTSYMIDEISRENTIRGVYVRKMKHLIANCEDEEEKEILQTSLKIGITGLS